VTPSARGLPEAFRNSIAGARRRIRLHATAGTLAMLRRRGWVRDPIVMSALSGASASSALVRRAGRRRVPYRAGTRTRTSPRCAQFRRLAGARSHRFTPQSVLGARHRSPPARRSPDPRGRAWAYRALADEPFVRVLEDGSGPTRAVRF
jgi:hypothetical protein